MNRKGSETYKSLLATRKQLPDLGDQEQMIMLESEAGSVPMSKNSLRGK